MHVLIPFASALSDSAAQVLRDLALPNLAQLLARLSPTKRDDGDPLSLSPPHERAWAGAQGWHGADGGLPFAAHAAQADGIEVGEQVWGLVTPTHWHVGRDHVTLADPAALNLDEFESRAAFDAVRELFASEGFAIEWGAPMRWYVSHERLRDLRCASLDRVIGRNVELWMREMRDPLIRRLQSELQLLLYPHALNDAREQRGELTLNSFWLSGCGAAQAVRNAELTIDDRLRAPLLAEDWVAWAQAWRDIDAGPLAQCLAAVRDRLPVALTLCGDRSAQRFEAAPQGLWQRVAGRWTAEAPHTVLEAL
jgi:hypothetical protein